MRKLLVIIFLFFTFQSFAQTELSFGIGASSVIDFDFQQIYEYKTSYTTMNSYFPFKAGVDLKFRLTPDFSLITGYNLLYRYMEVNLYTTTVGDIFNGYKMFTSEIPILFRYDGILKSYNFSLYCELGGSLDFMYAEQNVFGGYREILDYIVVARWGYFYTMNLPSGITPSLQGGIGFQNKIGNNKGILLVGVNYHFQVPEKISNEFDYYYDNGVGNITKEEWNFFTRSTYIGLNLKYYLPFNINLGKTKDHKKKTD